MNVETDIVLSITASPVGWAVILVRMYVETFKTDIIVLYVSYNVFDITLTDDVQYHGQSVDTENILLRSNENCKLLIIYFIRHVM